MLLQWFENVPDSKMNSKNDDPLPKFEQKKTKEE